MSFTASLVDVPYDLEDVRVPQTLVQVRGNYHYQRVLTLSVGLGYAAAGSLIVGMGFFLAPPLFVCRDGQRCTERQACSEGGYTLDSRSIHSMAYEWKLVCERKYEASLIGSLYFLGQILGSLVVGKMSDGLGRQRSCAWCLVALGVAQVLAAFAPAPYYIDALVLVAGAAQAVYCMSAYMLLSEMVTSELRSWYNGLSFTFWSFETVAVTLLFYLFDSWRLVMLFCALIVAIALPFVSFQPESIRWLVVSKRDRSRAMRVLRKVAKSNGLDPAAVTLQPLLAPADSPTSSLASGFTGLCSTCAMLKRLVGVAPLWMAATLAYFGLLMCVTLFSGNVYVNGVLLGLGEAVPNVVVGRCGNSLKRKAFICVLLLTGVVCFTMVWAIGDTHCSDYCLLTLLAGFTLLFLAMVTANSTFLMAFLYTAELFPTRVRGSAFAVCSTVARVGGLVASCLQLTQQYTGIHPLLVIAASMLAAAVTTLSLPETLGQSLLDYS